MPDTPPGIRRRTVVPSLAVAALLTAATACGADGADPDGARPAAEVSASADRAAGTVLSRPFDKPDLVLTDTHGKQYDLVEETRGKPVLLYFGYTHCPDVCPLTMSNIALAVKRLPEADRDKLRVVFVTSDPERDTPASLGSWLRAQNPDFIGLTGDFDTIQAGARSVGVALEPTVVEDDGEIVSTHGTQVLAFSPADDRAHVLYTKDATADTYAGDLPALIEGKLP